jgi:membrane protein DedA with SNARE-associated domain
MMRGAVATGPSGGGALVQEATANRIKQARMPYHSAVEAREVAEQALEWLHAQPPALSALALGAAAALEYLVPPFPGDSIAVAGGVLVAQGIVSIPAALLATTLGSIVGSLFMYGAGAMCGRHARVRAVVFRFIDAQKFERVAVVYRRWGRGLILANRFLPGLRVTFIVVAGLFGVPLVDVLLLGGISALAWNALLIGAGYAVGANLERVIELLERYTAAGWVIVASVLTMILARIVYKRLRRSAP